MYGLQDYLVGLSQLHELTSADERRAAWRQGMTELAKAADNRQPTPLEGLAPEALLDSVRVALSAGLVDEIGWLSRAEAAAAVLELATALPPGQEKRALGRRVLKTLHEGDALTFATLARALALGSPRALAGAPVRARVALALRLPLAVGRSADGLALALLCRPELEQEWLTTPSVGVLPARRLAARILERASREAIRRAQEGDDSGVRAFDRPSVRTAWGRLLADRESLVWRHVAVARGFLAAFDPVRMEEVMRALSPHFGPTEWRRAATSLAAGAAHDPEAALLRCRDLARGELCRRHPGVLVGLVFGAARAGEEEPEAANELITSLVQGGDLDVMEALAEFRREQLGGEIGAAAARQAVARLRAVPEPADDGVAALRDAIVADLSAERGAADGTLGQFLGGGLQAFADGKDLRPFAEGALATARQAIADLDGKGDSGEERRRTFRALRELDLGLLEDATLGELLTVSASDKAAEGMGPVIDPLGNWLLARESKPLPGGPLPHPVARQRRLRALLHLLDGERVVREASSPPERDLRLRAFRVLLARVEGDAASPLRRTLCAALARAADAMFRDELCELSDLLVAIAAKVRSPSDLQILSEASMVPDVKELYRTAAELARISAAAPAPGDRSFLEAFQTLARSLPPGTSPRVEGLRRALLDMGRALEGVVGAAALADLTQEGGPLEQLEPAVQYGAQLCAGARRRLGLGLAGPLPTAGPMVRALDAAIERAVREEDDDVAAPLHAAIDAVRVDLPVGFADVVARGLAAIAELPRERLADAVFTPVNSSQSAARQPLPQWLPPSRTVGGFYIVRPIGNGAGGSVFVARRAEERHEQTAESYALKVPSYSGQNAHTLSEHEFLQLFREEAGALLTLPQHQNLAGFVTFDARARPKPILVMELVPGPTVERIIEKQELSVPSAFAILRGISGGLHAMHRTGIGHFDVKPANIILRDSQGTGSYSSKLSTLDMAAPVPVLVDFGLAGRKLRPGCASPYYGAPEVWDSETYRLALEATAADVYAYCCLAYEMLTGRTLFDGESLPALIGNHLTHDGRPPRLSWMFADNHLVELAEILTAGLAPDPRTRPSIVEVGEALHQFAPNVSDRVWPLAG